MCELVERIGKLDLREAPILPFEVDSGRRAYPERAVHAGKDVVDDAIRDSLVDTITLKLASVIAVESVLRPYPQVANPVLLQRRDVEVSQPLGVFAKTVPLRVTDR